MASSWWKGWETNIFYILRKQNRKFVVSTSLQNHFGGTQELYWTHHEGSSYYWSWTIWLSWFQKTELPWKP